MFHGCAACTEIADIMLPVAREKVNSCPFYVAKETKPKFKQPVRLQLHQTQCAMNLSGTATVTQDAMTKGTRYYLKECATAKKASTTIYVQVSGGLLNDLTFVPLEHAMKVAQGTYLSLTK